MATVRVTIPATVTNLGPGLDSAALALSLHNIVELTDRDTGLSVEIHGEGEASLPKTPRNLAARGASIVFKRAMSTPSGIHLKLTNGIPFRSELGAEVATALGGMVAANIRLGGPFTREELLRMAITVVPQPAALTAALYGGFRLCTRVDGDIVHSGAALAPIAVGVVLPEMPPGTAPQAPPAETTLSAAAAAIGRAMLVTHALATGDYGLLACAMHDDLHEPARSQAYPGLEVLRDAGKRYGAASIVLSGSGPALVIFASAGLTEIIDGMRREYRMKCGRGLRHWILSPDTQGVSISEIGVFDREITAVQKKNTTAAPEGEASDG